MWFQKFQGDFSTDANMQNRNNITHLKELSSNKRECFVKLMGWVLALYFLI